MRLRYIPRQRRLTIHIKNHIFYCGGRHLFGLGSGKEEILVQRGCHSGPMDKAFADTNSYARCCFLLYCRALNPGHDKMLVRGLVVAVRRDGPVGADNCHWVELNVR